MESSAPAGLVIAIVLGFSVGFPLIWSGTLGLISIAGWRYLARNYREMRPPLGDRLPGARTVRVNLANYNGVVTGRAGRDGLYLSVMFLFRPFHPPVLIPWGDMEYQGPANIFFISYHKLKVGKEGKVTLWVSKRWFDHMAGYFSNHSTTPQSQDLFDPFQ
jgi:hypothetical protein